MTMDPPVEILLVEDNPDDVELSLHALRKHRISNRIHVVRDGAEALEFLFHPSGEPKPDVPKLILLDLKLPKVSGLEVLEKVKSNKNTRPIPVVVLTSSREDRDILDCYRLGVNSYIVKPVDFEQFSEAVCSVGLYWLVVNQPPVSSA